MKKIHIIPLFLFVLVLIAALTIPIALAQKQGGKLDYPVPRYPKIREITSVDKLLPSARFIVSKAKDLNMRPGYGIKGGERVLFLSDNIIDPLVVEAFVRAFREKGAKVDVWSFEAPPFPPDKLFEADDIEEWLKGTAGGTGFLAKKTYLSGYTGPGPWIAKVAEEQDYDLVVGINLFEPGKLPQNWLGLRMMWPTREMLAGPAATYPEEILYAIDRKGWEIIRQTKSVHITDPEGTDLRYDIDDEYWQIIEGQHPHIRVSGSPVEYRYGPGRSEIPLNYGHLSGYPVGLVIDKSNAEGIVAGTMGHQGPFPRIVLTIKNNEIVKIEGGGRYGKLWWEFLQKFKGIHYPVYPRAGAGFLVEASIGTHPKVYRPHNVWESQAGRTGFIDERRRSGIMHIGLGSYNTENMLWARQRGLPSSHYHVHLNFPTYEATLEDGRKVKLIDKGHLTVLDDPEVRKIAAKYGDPDQLLQENWIPAIPGINVEGSYEEYAKDPLKWLIKEQRMAYGELLDWRPYP
jgi:hypothetical protein